MIALKKASELKVYGISNSYPSYWNRISIDDFNEIAYLISFKNEVKECEIEFIDKMELSEEYHTDYFDDYMPCIYDDDAEEYIPLYEFLRV